MPLATVLTGLAAYLLGSIPTGYLLVRLFRNQDIRAVGSGNIGATNVLRTGGKGLGAATFVLDALKGCTAVWLASAVWSLLVVTRYEVLGLSYHQFQAIAALCCVLGHMYPVWLRFKGGKGVATGFGVFLVAAPLAALSAIGVFFVVLAISRYVSLASILGALSFPVFAWFLSPNDLTRPERPVFFAVQVTVALLIVAKHHQNIRRLFAGTERRIGAKQAA
jgi:acyl phosphate:glycerol-3-phosphate acyltransferase